MATRRFASRYLRRTRVAIAVAVTAGWTPLREIWQFDDVWLFLPYGTYAAYSAMPTSVMTPEFREVVLTNMRAQGATVKDFATRAR